MARRVWSGGCRARSAGGARVAAVPSWRPWRLPAPLSPSSVSLLRGQGHNLEPPRGTHWWTPLPEPWQGQGRRAPRASVRTPPDRPCASGWLPAKAMLSLVEAPWGQRTACPTLFLAPSLESLLVGGWVITGHLVVRAWAFPCLDRGSHEAHWWP